MVVTTVVTNCEMRRSTYLGGGAVSHNTQHTPHNPHTPKMAFFASAAAASSATSSAAINDIDSDDDVAPDDEVSGDVKSHTESPKTESDNNST